MEESLLRKPSYPLNKLFLADDTKTETVYDQTIIMEEDEMDDEEDKGS